MRRIGWARSSWVLCVLLLAAGCARTPPAPASLAPISFAGGPPIRLAVAQIEIVNEHQPTFQPPHVEHLMRTPPAAVAERWARERLVATGGPGLLRFIIKRASVVESELPRTGGVRGVFTIDQAKRYDALLEIELELRNERGLRDGLVTARAERRQSEREDATLAERERLWNEMMVQMGRELDIDLERNIRAGLTRVLVF